MSPRRRARHHQRTVNAAATEEELEMVDLEPVTRRVSDIVVAVRDDQLGAPTPCTESSLAALLDHLDGLAQGFTMAAQKTRRDGDQAPRADASHLGTDWRIRIPERLSTLAAAWREPDAWTGMTKAGGQDLPGELAGVIALDEVIVHGWDIAVASGQTFDCPPDLLEAAHGFVAATVTRSPNGTPGLFGPPVAVAGDAPLLDRLIGLTGRDPGWRAPQRA
jgi:uncharacterized protein (TIGR03086 family)